MIYKTQGYCVKPRSFNDIEKIIMPFRTFINPDNSDYLPIVWLGTSVENQEVTDRIEHLRGAPAIVRFISFEPLIGSVGNINLNNIHWAIVGGESGSSARPIKEEWIDDIYDACRIYNTAFFFKQWGRWGKDNKKRSKKANGREYKGTVWNELPIAYNL